MYVHTHIHIPNEEGLERLYMCFYVCGIEHMSNTILGKYNRKLTIGDIQIFMLV